LLAFCEIRAQAPNFVLALIALKMTLNLPLFIAHNKVFIHTVRLLHESEQNNVERLKFVFKLALLAQEFYAFYD
jgi:hypothetical protein